ncbi:MAG: CoA pyrophosphatase [Acidimicrobiia bacterium]
MIESTPWNAFAPETVDLRLTSVVERCRAFRPPVRSEHRYFEVDDPKPSAVAIPLIERGGVASLVITKRPGTMSHGGDWVFPGGRTDVGVDVDTRHTALRELHEELGVPMHSIDMVGQLDTHGPIISGLIVDSFVAVLDAGVEMHPNHREVAEVAFINLVDIFDPSRWYASNDYPMSTGQRLPKPQGARIESAMAMALPFFRITDDDVAWGLSARILLNLALNLHGQA